MQYGILTDLTKCSGCNACVMACKEINRLPHGTRETGLTSTTWTHLDHYGSTHVRRQCMHCCDPTCASVCPVAALRKSPEGPVVYDPDRCIGCRYCMVACPFNIPKYEWDKASPLVRKCNMCYENRVSKGQEPACTSVCPTGATLFGRREDLIREARERIRKSPGKYVDHIYGLHEAGGTSVLYLSSVPFDQLGFKVDVRGDPYPRLTWDILNKLPSVVSVGGALMVGIWWVIRRRQELETNGDTGIRVEKISASKEGGRDEEH